MYRYNRYRRLFGGEIDVSAKACGTKTKAKAMGRKDAYFMAGPGKAFEVSEPGFIPCCPAENYRRLSVIDLIDQGYVSFRT
jgi:hypothetical protein